VRDEGLQLAVPPPAEQNSSTHEQPARSEDRKDHDCGLRSPVERNQDEEECRRARTNRERLPRLQHRSVGTRRHPERHLGAQLAPTRYVVLRHGDRVVMVVVVPMRAAARAPQEVPTGHVVILGVLQMSVTPIVEITAEVAPECLGSFPSEPPHGLTVPRAGRRRSALRSGRSFVEEVVPRSALLRCHLRADDEPTPRTPVWVSPMAQLVWTRDALDRVANRFQFVGRGELDHESHVVELRSRRTNTPGASSSQSHLGEPSTKRRTALMR
jgi:hypothetical protein